MGMSYRRAWLLVDTMNRCFRTPLVDAAPGGTRGGGARLTPLGETVLARYRALAARLERTAAGTARTLAADLLPAPRPVPQPARRRRPG
jgi:molybdate transport system regulatory protein